jgi:hypothetical protein
MSSGISQIEYWREVNKPNKNANSANTKNVTEGGPGAVYLSYDVFLGLSVIGGLLALDHLYLRSPLTFIAKLIVNVLTLGWGKNIASWIALKLGYASCGCEERRIWLNEYFGCNEGIKLN